MLARPAIEAAAGECRRVRRGVQQIRKCVTASTGAAVVRA
jgi:hypothetical protein